MNVLPDTTVWSMVFRRKAGNLDPDENAAGTALKRLIQLDSAQLLGVVRQELLSGLRERSQFTRLQHLLLAFPDVEVGRADYEEAAAIHNTCRAKGISGNSTDFLICAVSIRRDWPILTLDRDFTGYASCTSLRLYTAGIEHN